LLRQYLLLLYETPVVFYSSFNIKNDAGSAKALKMAIFHQNSINCRICFVSGPKIIKVDLIIVQLTKTETLEKTHVCRGYQPRNGYFHSFSKENPVLLARLPPKPSVKLDFWTFLLCLI
jgi:hypothetical protein